MTPAFEHVQEGNVEKTALAKGTEVTLPVCEHCGRIAKQPNTPKGGTKYFCDGGTKNSHKKVRMEPYVFQCVGPKNPPQ